MVLVNWNHLLKSSPTIQFEQYFYQIFVVENFHNFYNYTVTMKILFFHTRPRHKVNLASNAQVAQVL